MKNQVDQDLYFLQDHCTIVPPFNRFISIKNTALFKNLRRLRIFRSFDPIILNETSFNAASKQNKLTNQITLKRSLATSAASPLALANHAAAQTSSSLNPGTSFQIDADWMVSEPIRSHVSN